MPIVGSILRTALSKNRCPLFALLALLFAAAAAQAQTQPHVEDCSKGAYLDGRFTFVNNCGQPITVWFMRRGGQPVRRDLAPGARFDTRMTQTNPGWVSARCAAGFKPTVRFSKDNWQALLDSRYSCVK